MAYGRGGGCIPGGPIPGLDPGGGIPGGGIPGGGIPGGGIPGGGIPLPIMPTGIPGGGMPIGGTPLPCPGGGPPGPGGLDGGPPGGGPEAGAGPGPDDGGPVPGVYCLGAAAVVAPFAAAAACGVMTCCDGPPTPRTGPDSPAGAPMLVDETPLPAALPTPVPGAALAAGTFDLSCLAGGASTVNDTRCSPRKRTKPKTRFSSLSGPLFFGFTRRNSSVSPRMRFMCLSKARNVPMNTRPSWRVHLIL